MSTLMQINLSIIVGLCGFGAFILGGGGIYVGIIFGAAIAGILTFCIWLSELE